MVCHLDVPWVALTSWIETFSVDGRKSQGQPPFGCIKSCESWGKLPSLGDFYGTLVGKYTSVYGPHGGLMIYIPSLKLTFSPLKIDGWKMTCPFLPFPIFRGISFQFQGGQWHIRYLHSQ